MASLRSACTIAFSCLLPSALAGCGHGDVFAPAAHGSTLPKSSIGFPTRLTFNRGHDREASFLSDGSGLLYTFEQFRYAEGDWCLGVLPPRGGRATRTVCRDEAGTQDSVDALRAAAVGPGGLIAYVRQSSRPRQLAPNVHELVVASWQSPGTALHSFNLPYTLPGESLHASVTQLRWLDSTSFVYRADMAGYFRACTGCVTDTVSSGRALVLVSVAGGVATRTLIPGTRYASSVATRGGDEVFYTRGGAGVVWIWTRSTGATSVAWDFGGTIARGVQIAGNRLVALTGGGAAFGFSTTFQDSVQVDNGGSLRVVDLVSGTVGIVDQFALYRNPALSPDGLHLVVENLARAPDLFLFELQP